MREIFQYVVHTGSRWNPKLKSGLLLKVIDHVFTVARAEAKAIEDIATAF